MSKETVSVSMPEIITRLQQIILPDVDLILGIASGGVVPACLLAYKLQKPMRLIHINYRDIENRPKFQQPRLLREFQLNRPDQKILLVDDVSVSGSTLNYVKNFLKDHRVSTFTLKGHADYVLFPEITSCVTWPWK